MQFINPGSIHKPVANSYTHGCEIPANSRLLFVSGQLGYTKEGKTPDTIEDQLEVAWANVKVILSDASMTTDNIIKINCFLADVKFGEAYLTALEKHLGDHRPAQTAVVVKQLWSEEWFFEFDVIAASPT